MKRKYKVLIFTVIVIAAAAAALVSYLRPMPVEMVRVGYGDLSSRFTAEGTLLPVDSQVINAGSAGTAGEIFYKPGEPVRRGEALIRMGPSSLLELQIQKETFVRQLEEAKNVSDRLFGENGTAWSELAAAQKEFDLAEREYQNHRILAEEAGGVSQMDLAQLKLRRDLAAERVAQAQEDCSESTQDYYRRQIASCEAQLKAMETTSRPVDITMPYDGIFWEVYVETGSAVSPGQAVAKVYRPDQMKIQVSLLTEDAANLAVGDEASVSFAGRTVLPARISYLSSVAKSGYSVIGVEENRCEAELVPEGEIPANAGAGHEADVTFTVSYAVHTLAVPDTALAPFEEGEGVYVIDGDRARLVPVKTGVSAGGKTVIEKGLSEGDLVVSDPYAETFRAGKRVKTAVSEEAKPGAKE